MRQKIGMAFAILTILASTFGFAPSVADATAPPEGDACYEQIPQTKWERPTTEHKYERTTQVVQHRYEKFVKGVKERRGVFVWHSVDSFDWRDYPGAGPLAWGQVPSPMSGGHDSTFGQFTQGISTYRYRSTHFEYRSIDTRMVPGPTERTGWLASPPAGDGWAVVNTRPGTPEASGWIDGTNPPAGDGWVKKGDRTRNGAEIPCPVPNSLATSHELRCGAIDITLRNVSPWIYPTSVEISRDGGETWGGHSYGPTVDNRTNGGLSGPQKDQSVTRTIVFAEDENGGSVMVRYRVQAGSERNLYVGLPVGEWTTVTINTDCAANPISDGRYTIAESCNGFEFTFTNPVEPGENEVGEAVEFVLNGETITVEPNETVKRSVTGLEGETVFYVLTGPGIDGELVGSLVADCFDEVEIPTPTVTRACDESALVTVPTVPGLRWTAPGIAPGVASPFAVVDGVESLTFIWTADDGFEIVGETTFTLEIPANEPCPEETPPTTTPPTTTPPTPEEPVCPTNTNIGMDDANCHEDTPSAPETPAEGSLPRTGNNPLTSALVALGALGLGAVIVAIGRRLTT